MKTFRIPCQWTVYGVVYVEANDLDEAVTKAMGQETPLPTESDYAGDSFQCFRDEATEEDV